MRAVLIAVLLLIAPVTYAEDYPWLKSAPDFEKLFTLVLVFGCPFGEGAVNAGLDGELLRARIKPADAAANVYLRLRVNCTPLYKNEKITHHFITATYSWCTQVTPDHYEKNADEYLVLCDDLRPRFEELWGVDRPYSELVYSIVRESDRAITLFIKQNM